MPTTSLVILWLYACIRNAYVQHLKEVFKKGIKELTFTQNTIEHMIESYGTDLLQPEKLDYHVLEKVLPFWLYHLIDE